MIPPRGPAAGAAHLEKIYHTPLQCVNVKGALLRAVSESPRRFDSEGPDDEGTDVPERFGKEV